MLLDMRGDVAGWSPEAERLLGYAADQVYGRHPAELLYAPADIGRLLGEREGADAEPAQRPEVPRQRDGHAVAAAVAARLIFRPEIGPQRLIRASDCETLQRGDLKEAVMQQMFADAPFIFDVFDTQPCFMTDDCYRGKEVAGPSVAEVAPAGTFDWEAVEDWQRHVLESCRRRDGDSPTSRALGPHDLRQPDWRPASSVVGVAPRTLRPWCQVDGLMSSSATH